jgi:hypothetical protein
MWVHAHGEDSPAGRVFRPADYPLPPSRGRVSFEFRPDGSFVEMTIAPTDRLEPAQGTWTLDGDRLVLCDAGDPSDGKRTYRVVALAADRLVLVGPLGAGA